MRFLQTHNQGLRQLLLTVSWDLRTYRAEMINTIETGIGIGLFPIIGIGIGIGFKRTLLIGIGIGIGKFLFWPIGFSIGIAKTYNYWIWYWYLKY